VFNDDFFRSIKGIIASQERMRRSFESPMKAAIEAQEKYKALMKSPFQEVIDFQNKLKKIIIPNFAQQIQDAASDVEKFKFIMLEYGFPPHYDLDIKQMRMIAHYYETNGREETETLLNDVLVQLYTDEEIQGYIDRWLGIKWLTNRHQILSEGIDAHISCKYYSAISTLLPQLEGVLVSKAEHSGWLSQKKLQGLIESVLNETGFFIKSSCNTTWGRYKVWLQTKFNQVYCFV
jgi:hypothetical protein